MENEDIASILIAEVLNEAQNQIKETMKEIMAALCSRPTPLASIACAEMLYTFVCVKGNADNQLATSELLSKIAKELELMSRISAFTEENKTRTVKEKENILLGLQACMASKEENHKILCVEEREDGFSFELLTEMPAAPNRNNPYGYFALN